MDGTADARTVRADLYGGSSPHPGPIHEVTP